MMDLILTILSKVFTVTFFQKAVTQGVPLLFGATGEILTEKAGNLNLSKCFALAGAPFHITSNAVCPGNILTPMGKTLSWSKKDPKTYIPAGRYGTAEDIANAVLFYASDLSDYVTGDYMNVNGGLYM